MKITFLGTGTSQGVPVIGCNCIVCKSSDPLDNRLRTSILISDNGRNFVIDTGPDFRQQMLREKVKQVDAVVFTHSHKDHTAGFDDIRAFNFINKKALDVYATEDVWDVLKKEFAYIFAEDKYPGIPEITPYTFENKPFKIFNTEFIPILTYHYKLPVFGFRVNDFTYITDANYISDEELEKVKGSKVVVLNALRREKHISHFNLNEAIEIIQKIKPEKAYFIHMSHQIGLHKEVMEELPEGIELSYDGLTLEV
jgi:phosphoribosyl 1,2-cyclic phosphate phosphodiesterase